jgi:hypothetical protein
MTQPVWPLFTTPPVPLPEMVIRSRREVSTRDATNARFYELWQTDGKYSVQNRPDLNAQAPFHEFLPINSRSSEKKFKLQPRFEAEGPKLGQNTYFDRYDPSYDSRNAVRELQSTVYEDKSVESIPQNNSFLTRSMAHRWIDEAEMKKLTEAAEKMRPSMDDYAKSYR